MVSPAPHPIISLIDKYAPGDGNINTIKMSMFKHYDYDREKHFNAQVSQNLKLLSKKIKLASFLP